MRQPEIRAWLLSETSGIAMTLLGMPLDQLLWHVFPLDGYLDPYALWRCSHRG